MRLLRYYILALAVAATLCASSQGVATWLETEGDLGTLHEEGGRASCALRLVNTGDQPLIIVRVQSTCGCTATEFPRQPIEPGDTAAVQLTYNPIGRPGQFHKDVFVYTDGTPARCRLSVKGNVIPAPRSLEQDYPAVIGPLRLEGLSVPFGEITRPKQRNAYLDVYNAGDDTLQVAVTDVPAHIQAVVEPSAIAPGTVASLNVHFDTGKAPLWGFNCDSVQLVVQPLGAATASTGWVSVMAQVREDFTALSEKQWAEAPIARIVTDNGVSDRLVFDRAARGEQVTLTFAVENAGHDELRIRRLWSTSGITATADREQVKAGKRTTVTVTVDTASCADDIYEGVLTVMTNDPHQPTILLRVVGQLTD